MIKVHRRFFEHFCATRGRSIADVAGCIHAADDVFFVIDTGHVSYPKTDTRPPRACGGRPGTALKALLGQIGITSTPSCSCNARAAEMDARGCDWCEANIHTIVGWLREEAGKRSLPFLPAAGRILVRRAIKNARRAASSASTLTDP